MVADIILHSICSYELSTVVVDLAEKREGFDCQGWMTLGKALFRLAKRFRDEHSGRKMEVKIQTPLLNLLNEYPIHGLDQEATVEICPPQKTERDRHLV